MSDYTEETESVEQDVANRSNSGPMLLAASCQLVAGRTANPDSALLASPFRKPYVIDEVRFQVALPVGDGVGLVPDFNMGGSVRCRLQLGRMAVTRDFVPIWLFGTNLNSEYLADTTFSGALLGTSFSHFRWRLPRPLYVPAGQQLIASFSREIDGSSSTATVWIAYAGRYLPPDSKPPKEIDVPYVTTYIGVKDAEVGQSNEKDLVNPFDGPLNVQRMIGRVQLEQSGGIAEGAGMTASPTTFQGPAVIIKDSYGHNVIGDFAAFSEVFSLVRRGWTFHRVLEPRERYHLYYRGIPTAGTVMVSLVGWRKEALK